MGVPQIAQTIMGGDDSPLKLFDLEWDSQFGKMRFWEFVNVDSENAKAGTLVDTFSMKGNSIYADLTFVRTINLSTAVNYTIRIRLTRVGN
jgi:hypothetical protein